MDCAGIDVIWFVAQQRIIWAVDPVSVSCRPLFAVIFLAVAGIVFIQKVIQAISLIEAQFIETFAQSLISTRSADLLRRTGASTIGPDRPGLVCARLFPRFDAGLVLPDIAEAVFVQTGRASCRERGCPYV